MARVSDTDCVNRVIRHMDLWLGPLPNRQEAKEIRGYIMETMAMIAPLLPSDDAIEKLNTYLYIRKASQMHCIVAWTMFMDMRNLANLHTIPERVAHVA